MVYEGLIMSDFLGGIFDGINQDKGFMYGIASNAISYAQSKKAQKRAYEYARLLQQQQYDLTQQGYRESSKNIRTGLEAAGYNPMLALNKAGSSVNVAGGTPVAANATAAPDLISGAALGHQTALTDAQTKNVEKDTELKAYDKPLKLLGDVINNVKPEEASRIASDVRNNLSNMYNATSGYLKQGFSSLFDNIRHLDFSKQQTILKGYVSNLSDMDLGMLKQELSPAEFYAIQRAKFESRFADKSTLPSNLRNSFPQ